LAEIDNRTRLSRILDFRHIYRVHRWPGTVRQLLELFKDWLIDLRHNTRTSGDMSGEALGIGANNYCSYEASPWDTLERVIDPHSISRADVFIDFGSGKGRMLYQAARLYPFKRVIGVEINGCLNTIAKRNLDKHRDRLRCKAIEIITTDVSKFEVPDDVTVVFLFNPFVGETFENLVRKLRGSLISHPRNIRVIYKIPKMHECLIANGFSEICRHSDITVYKNR
jgi:hypothetical protein